MQNGNDSEQEGMVQALNMKDYLLKMELHLFEINCGHSLNCCKNTKKGLKHTYIYFISLHTKNKVFY